MSSYDALAVANSIIEISQKNKSEITHLKLQKLTYFSHGWYLVLTEGIPLIYEPILAWKYGPVIKSIYDEFKLFGDRPIDKLAKKISGPFNLLEKDICPKVENDYPLGLLNKVWEVYGNSHALYLSEVTHLPGFPMG